MAADKICTQVRKLMDEGKYARAAELGESAATAAFGDQLNSNFFALLAAAHLASGSMPAARLAIVRGNAELNDKSLEFVQRVLVSRQSNKIADAINALKSGPPNVIDVFRDILVCDLAATLAVIYSPASIGDVCQHISLNAEDVVGCLKRAGRHFGVVAAQDGSLKRVAIVRDTAAAAATASVADAAVSGASSSDKGGVASVDLITQAALMAAQPVDRSWNK